MQKHAKTINTCNFSKNCAYTPFLHTMQVVPGMARIVLDGSLSQTIGQHCVWHTGIAGKCHRVLFQVNSWLSKLLKGWKFWSLMREYYPKSYNPSSNFAHFVAGDRFIPEAPRKDVHQQSFLHSPLIQAALVRSYHYLKQFRAGNVKLFWGWQPPNLKTSKESISLTYPPESHIRNLVKHLGT